MNCPYCGNQLFDQRLIPQRTKAALDAYVLERRPVGGFLEAILTNDLKGAFNTADTDNLAAIPAIVSYMYNHMPAPCQGSPERVKKWLARRE